MQKVSLSDTHLAWETCEECGGDLLGIGRTWIESQKRAQMLLAVHVLKEHHIFYQESH